MGGIEYIFCPLPLFSTHTFFIFMPYPNEKYKIAELCANLSTPPYPPPHHVPQSNSTIYTIHCTKSPLPWPTHINFHLQWYYEGDEGIMFGPFSLTQMRAWYSGGHLPQSLRVRRGSSGELFRLADEIETFESKDACNEWLYMSDVGPQGPFTHAQMAVWLQHGYLSCELKVARGETEPWKPLSDFIGENKDFQMRE